MNWPDWLPIRDDLRGERPYGAPQWHVSARLNTNENPYPLPDEVVRAIAAKIEDVASGLNRYPDRDAVELRSELAQYLNKCGASQVQFAQVWAANGSNEILQQVLMAFGGAGRRAIGFIPSYSMHGIIAKSTQTEWVNGIRGQAFSLDADSIIAQAENAKARLIFLTSPNNPTGTAIDPRVIERVLQSAPNTLVVVDEAYAEFARDPHATSLSMLATHPNLIVSRTMSKAFGMAGTRIGYLAAHAKVVEALQLVRLPYHLGTPTQAIALVALRFQEVLLQNVERIKEQRDRIVTELRAMGFSPEPSDANFVLFGGISDTQALWQLLVDRGVLIRDVGLPGMLRVTAGTEPETSFFLESLKSAKHET